MSIQSRLARLEKLVRPVCHHPCHVDPFQIPIIELRDGEEEPPYGYDLTDDARCPDCGRKAPIQRIVVVLPAETRP